MTVALRQLYPVSRLYWLQQPAGLAFMLFDALLLPFFILFLGWRLSQGDQASLSGFLAGALVVGIGIGATSKVGFAVLSDVHADRLSLLRAAGVQKRSYLTVQILAGVLFGILSMLATGLAMKALTGIGPGLSRLPEYLALAVLGGAAMGLVGAAIAMSAPDFRRGYTRLSTATVGITFLSPVFFPAGDLWTVAQAIAWLSPLTHMAEILRAILAGAAGPIQHWVALTLLAFGLAALVGKRLTWR